MAETEYDRRIEKGIQYKDSEFSHAMIRLWPDGRLCVSRLSKHGTHWIFVRLATDEDVAGIKKMLNAKSKAEELFGE